MTGLAAFRRDLGPRMATTSVVVMSEFGRRVLGRWPGLRRELLDSPGDLPVWNNCRNILAPVLQRHGAAPESLQRIFPDFVLASLGWY